MKLKSREKTNCRRKLFVFTFWKFDQLNRCSKRVDRWIDWLSIEFVEHVDIRVEEKGMERSSSDTEESTRNFSRKIDAEQNLKEKRENKRRTSSSSENDTCHSLKPIVDIRLTKFRDRRSTTFGFWWIDFRFRFSFLMMMNHWWNVMTNTIHSF